MIVHSEEFSSRRFPNHPKLLAMNNQGGLHVYRSG